MGCGIATRESCTHADENMHRQRVLDALGTEEDIDSICLRRTKLCLKPLTTRRCAVRRLLAHGCASVWDSPAERRVTYNHLSDTTQPVGDHEQLCGRQIEGREPNSPEHRSRYATLPYNCSASVQCKEGFDTACIRL